MAKDLEYSNPTDLVMPVYGRNIQKMVQLACKIENREERTNCAKTIINVMGNLFPDIRDSIDYKHKLWEHIAFMSNYQLDIDYPYPIEKIFYDKTNFVKMERNTTPIRTKYYGRIVEEMIDKIAAMENPDERKEAIRIVANQMKKNYITWNKKEVVDNEIIYKDLYKLSKGKIKVDDDMKLYHSKDIKKNTPSNVPTTNERFNKFKKKKR